MVFPVPNLNITKPIVKQSIKSPCVLLRLHQAIKPQELNASKLVKQLLTRYRVPAAVHARKAFALQ